MRCGRRGAGVSAPRSALTGSRRAVRTTTRVIYCPPADRSGSMKPINLRIADELGVREQQVAAAISLLDGGATVPFVARYRKEATGALDDTQLRTLEERLRYLRELDERRAAILESIDQQGKLDATLKQAINAADSKARLEDLYLPYRPKRRTKAQIAREAGLEPLAEAFSRSRSNTRSSWLAGTSTRIRSENTTGITPARARGVPDAVFGVPTVTDILRELEKPGPDPRPVFKTARFREGVEKLEDLEPGMVLEGVVTNVAAFGAFVDVGVHQDGLVHISAMANTYVSDPRKIATPGEVVRVKVLEVDPKRRRISLTMRLDDTPGDRTTAARSAIAASRSEKRLGPAKTRAAEGNFVPASGEMAEAFRRARPMGKVPGRR